MPDFGFSRQSPDEVTSGPDRLRHLDADRTAAQDD
jgi:hypothetical protein